MYALARAHTHTHTQTHTPVHTHTNIYTQSNTHTHTLSLFLPLILSWTHRQTQACKLMRARTHTQTTNKHKKQKQTNKKPIHIKLVIKGNPMNQVDRNQAELSKGHNVEFFRPQYSTGGVCILELIICEIASLSCRHAKTIWCSSRFPIDSNLVLSVKTVK